MTYTVTERPCGSGVTFAVLNVHGREVTSSRDLLEACMLAASLKTGIHTFDPRKVGGVYYNAYWRHWYVVTDIVLPTLPGSIQITEYAPDSDSRQRTHMTAWDKDRDRILVDPS